LEAICPIRISFLSPVWECGHYQSLQAIIAVTRHIAVGVGHADQKVVRVAIRGDRTERIDRLDEAAVGVEAFLHRIPVRIGSPSKYEACHTIVVVVAIMSGEIERRTCCRRWQSL